MSAVYDGYTAAHASDRLCYWCSAWVAHVGSMTAVLQHHADKMLLVQGVTHVGSITVIQPIRQGVLLVQRVTHVCSMTVLQSIRQAVLLVQGITHVYAVFLLYSPSDRLCYWFKGSPMYAVYDCRTAHQTGCVTGSVRDPCMQYDCF